MKRDALPAFDGDDVRVQLDNMSRQPFKDLLSAVIEAAPDEEALALFARKSPDRWGQLLAILGRLSGYSDRIAIDASLAVRVPEMSDGEILGRLAELATLTGWERTKVGRA